MVDTFKLADGSPARKFASVEEMDETMITRWNEVVRPQDHVWHLGDVAMRQQAVDRILPRLTGHKRLIPGNHDIFKTKLYKKYFEEIKGVRVLDGLIFTHIPIAPWCYRGARFLANVHGHLHCNAPLVSTWAGNGGPIGRDPGEGDNWEKRYVNISVEMIDYRPVSLEEIKSWL